MLDMDISKIKFLKGLGLSAAIGLMIGGGISLLYKDLSWFCQYGLISKIGQCTNHLVYPLLIAFTAVLVYLAGFLLFILMKLWQKQ